MARYVLVEIADNTDAEAYVASLQSEAKNLVAVPLADDPAQYRMAEIAITVIGLYGAITPTNRCVCPPPKKGEPPLRRVRGQKLGWWVHDKCGKPNSISYQMPNNLLLPNQDVATRQAWLAAVSLGVKGEPYVMQNPHPPREAQA